MTMNIKKARISSPQRVKAVYGVGVDIGATYIRVALADGKGDIVDKMTEPTVKTGESLDLTHQIIRMIKALLENNSVGKECLIGIGVGTIGPLDLKKGAIINSPNLPFKEVPLLEPLEKAFEVRVKILNDCTAAVVGEKIFGADKGLDNIVYITISTGIGGGAYVDGHLLIGKDGNAAEIGHMVVDPEGLLICGCGKRGHWEAYCFGANIPRYARILLSRKAGIESSLVYKYAEGDLRNLTAKIIYGAAREGDEVALEIVEKINTYNAVGVTNVINVYDPELITLGSSVVLNNVDLVVEAIKEKVGGYVMNRLPEIRVTPLAGDVVLYGAIARTGSLKYVPF